MSKSILWILTIFLSLAMIALVGIQAFWFKNSIDAERKQLGMVVSQVLDNIRGELQENYTITTILEEIQPPLANHQSRSTWHYKIDGRSYVGENVDHTDGGGAVVYSEPHQSVINQKVEIIDDSMVVVIGEDQDKGDTLLISAMHPEEIRLELSRSYIDQDLFVRKIVRQMMAEGESIEDRISATGMERMLTTRLREKGVDMPFEYAVYYEGKPPIYQSEAFHEYEEDCKYYRSVLLPGNIYNRPTWVSVYFPGERRHFLHSAGIMGGTSALILVFVLGLFSLALFVIFRQKRLSEMKNDFVNNMTHELKTPIATISLASQMLNDRSIPDEQKNLGQISRIIQTESRQLGFQVERVLQMAIFDHGKLRLKLEEVHLHELIETVAQNFLLQVDRRSGRLDYLPEADNDLINGDVMHLTNVVSNLLENAMKYSPKNPEISISTLNENNSLVFSVSDRGIGISKENQKRIFDKFYRVPTGNVHNVKGFGLGLSYVKLIVEAHGGSVDVKSETGKGSDFLIHLPLYNERD